MRAFYPPVLFFILIFQSVFVLNLAAEESPMVTALLGDEDPAVELADLGIEQLINIKVTTVGKKEQPLYEAAAAVFVITAEDIRRSGATTIPELLRLAPGVNVAQINANMWAISIRGLNDLFANHLLVLMDGRSIYTPLFGGVFWDTADTLIEDIDRIEVIRGPGATLWGSNAVNGVVNIITKGAKDTQGGFVAGGGGTKERGFGGMRYGDKLGDQSHYRVFAKYFNRDDFETTAGDSAGDAWDAVRGGARLDSELSAKDNLTVQGDFYYEERGLNFSVPTLSAPFVEEEKENRSNWGGYGLARYNRTVSDTSDYQVQFYYNHDSRDDLLIQHRLSTYDLEFQHKSQPFNRQEIIWGVGWRYYSDDFAETDTIAFGDNSKDYDLVKYFIQDEITLLPDTLALILGSRFEHNQFTGFEFQPSGQLIWTPDEKRSIWTSVSRAVRTPTRSHDDIRLNVTAFETPTGLPGLATVNGNPNFESDNLTAYELGYRQQISNSFSFDIAAFYNDYSDLFSVEPGEPTLITGDLTPYISQPFTFENGLNGETYGAELSMDLRPKDWWRLVFTYSYLDIAISKKSGSLDFIGVQQETESPDNQFMLRSLVDLPNNFEFDSAFRFVDALSAPGIESYFGLDLRLGWRPSRDIEVSIVGQNLIEEHSEFVPVGFVNIPETEIPRAVYGKIKVSF